MVRLRGVGVLLPLEILFIFTLLMGEILLAPPTAALEADRTLQRVPLTKGTLLIPMDHNQNDQLRVFGLVHALLRNGIPIYRMLGPPDRIIPSDLHPTGTTQQGGPIFVPKSLEPKVAEIASGFPTVTLDRLNAPYTAENVIIAQQPTRILVVRGKQEYGLSDILLESMGIPYELMTVEELSQTPSRAFAFELVVVDCNGWAGESDVVTVADAFQQYVAGGGNLLYNDIALLDLQNIFPGFIPVNAVRKITVNATFHELGDSLSQNGGPEVVPIELAPSGNAMGKPTSGVVRVIVDTEEYSDFFKNREYRNLAAYFPYGAGTVTGISFHPQAQHGEGFNATARLYGNRFVEATPFISSGELPTITPLVLGSPLPPPPAPPPPPPPPALAILNPLPAHYVYAGFAAVGLTSALRGRLALKRKGLVAVRA